jgi:hypothetical protein
LLTLIAIFLLGNSTVSAQDKYNPKYLTKENDPLTRDAKTLTPNGWIEMKEETSVAPDQFFERYGTSLGLAANPHLKFEQTKSETGAKGAEHRRYQLYYDNIEVEGLEFFNPSPLRGGFYKRKPRSRRLSAQCVSRLGADGTLQNLSINPVRSKVLYDRVCAFCSILPSGFEQIFG